MKKNKLFFLLSFLLCSCTPKEGTSPSLGSFPLSPSEEPPISFSSISMEQETKRGEWKEETALEMQKLLGETLPIPFSLSPSYSIVIDKIEGSSAYYLNPYWEHATEKQYEEYRQLFLLDGYQLDEGEKEEDVLWINGEKENKFHQTIHIRFAYYTNQQIPYLDVYAYVDIVGGAYQEITSPDFVLSSSDFTSSYPKEETSFSKGNYEFSYQYLMSSGEVIQMQKTNGLIYNTTSLFPIEEIYLKDLKDHLFVEVYAGTSPTQLTKVSSYGNGFYLGGATYFSIRANRREVIYITEIQFLRSES